jgi:flagellar hook-length control protein FliK
LAAVSGTAEQKAAEPLAALSGTGGKGLLADGQTESLKTAPAVPAATITDDKAAKFAVASATAEKTVSAEPFANDTLSANAIAPLSANAPGHVSHLALKHDSALSVNTSVRDQNWATDLGQKVVWLASNDKQSAQLTLNPPQLGPIEVSLDVDKGNASVSFVSANAEVRDAIETALPRLREMFASAGIELGQTNVGAQSFSQQQSGSNEQNRSSSRWIGDNAILAAETTGSLQTGAFSAQQGNGMVDIFA